MSDSLRVLHVISAVSALQGGPSYAVPSLIRAHATAEPSTRATLLSSDYRIDAADRARLAATLPPGTDVHLPRFYGRHTFAYAPGLVGWMREHVAGYDLVVLHTLLQPVMSAAARVASRAGVPYVVTAHGTLSRYVMEHRNAAAKRLYLRLVDGATLRRAAAVHCTTASEAAQVEALGYGVPAVVVPLPFESLPDGPPLVAPDRDAIVCLSRLDPVKGFDVLLPAFARVAAARPNTHLWVAGSGAPSYEAHLRAEVEAAGLTSRVSFTGFITGDDKAALLARAAVFVLPSRKENFGLAVVEAMAAGRPVVISPEVDLAPAVEGAGAGAVVPRDPEALADALLRMLDDPAAADAMGARGAAFVRDHLAPDAVGRALSRFYHSAADRSGSPSSSGS